MAVSRAMRRLLRIRELEEEQRRLALESATGDLRRLESGLVAARQQAGHGRRLVQSSAYSAELPDRIAGLEETRAALRMAELLEPLIEDAELEVAERRQEFLTKRVEHRQAETLIEEVKARDDLDAGRREQQSLDDWYRSRLQREDGHADSKPLATGARQEAAAGDRT